MLAPFTIKARMANHSKVFPVELEKRCKEWFSQLPELSGVQVPRYYREVGKNVVDTSIHTMVDASQLAYAAVSYVQHEYEDGKVTAICCSKSACCTYKSNKYS